MTKMMVTEFALKNVPVRGERPRAQQKQKHHYSEVNAIAPGVLLSEMTNVTIEGVEMSVANFWR